MRGVSAEPRLKVADEKPGPLSVSDGLKKDRANLDTISLAMGRHAVGKPDLSGFVQTSDTLLEHARADMCLRIPRFHAPVASPL